jgi:VRR-NUC domain
MGECAWPPETPAVKATPPREAPVDCPPASATEVLAASMREEDLLVSITCGTRNRPGLCRLHKLKWYHPYDSRRSASGWPDLAIAGPGGILFAELKSQSGRVSPAQKEWISVLESSGQAVFTWRPADLLSGEINRELAAIAKPGRRA